MAYVRRLSLSDLYFGHIDAKNELLEDTPTTRLRFRHAFIIPDNVIETKFLDGEKYIIQGLKGIGKTALLRYLGLIAEEQGAAVRFLLFRREVAGGERQQLSRAADAFQVVTGGVPFHEQEYVDVWKWLLHRIVVASLEANQRCGVIVRDMNYNRYRAAVTALPGDEKSGLLRFLPRVKQGSVEVRGDLGVVSGGASLDFEFVNGSKTRATFSSVLRTSDGAFDSLVPGSGRLYVMIDELELTLGRKKSYERDVRLIRDLLKVSNEFNERCRVKGLPIRVLVAVRSEVLTSVAASGHEVNKIVEDFGTHITWHRRGNDPTHPLLQIVARRINWAEKSAGLAPTPQEEIWQRYFPSEVQRTPVREYILHQTWYRPRDIVRLFTSICEAFPGETTFQHRHFDEVRREYSSESWADATEELRTAYSEDDLDTIKRLLTGFRTRFTIYQFVNRLNDLRGFYKGVDALFEKMRPGDVLADLYRVGIIGNDYKDSKGDFRQRWSFRGDTEPLLERQFAIHRALWPSLSIV